MTFQKPKFDIIFQRGRVRLKAVTLSKICWMPPKQRPAHDNGYIVSYIEYFLSFKNDIVTISPFQKYNI